MSNLKKKINTLMNTDVNLGVEDDPSVALRIEYKKKSGEMFRYTMSHKTALKGFAFIMISLTIFILIMEVV